MTTTLMHDHPAWDTTSDGGAVRVLRVKATPTIVSWSPADPDAVRIEPATEPLQVIDRITSPVVTGAIAALGLEAASLGCVLRVRNIDLWDALATAIIRQVIRANQARLMYQRFCRAHGEAVPTPWGTRHLIPTAEVVAKLPTLAFATLGMAFKARALVAAAEAAMACQDSWQHLTPIELVTQLQRIPRVGPWTAGATVADYSGDFSLYPYADLAVRTWARRAAPAIDWPGDEPMFGAYWRRHTGRHLSDLTLLVLAWGGSRAPDS